MKDNLNITLNIADELYKLTIPREDEEIAREAAKRINSMLRQFKDMSPTRAMTCVAISFARAYLSALRDNAHVDSCLSDLDARLDKLLDER
ncbi:MAG: cell division protein ZapA [Paramuribaculum sp.]|nr:cell division protein ZapA [Paramuribaculum sp.]MDE7151179.1 cell division protein ZapA [Candidatus Amulumruptor sp.]MDE7236896.1 cell division protein ZapA [Paramuribaculum sp.]